MARSPARFARPVCGVAALALFAACGGVSDPFSPSSSAGASFTSGGAPHAGASNSGGSLGVGASGSPASGGSSAAGANSAGAGASSAGSTSQAGAGASSSGGSSSGNAGNAGSAGLVADAGSDDGGDTCQTLLATASKQLEAAQACSVAADSNQCTGEVESTCHCQVAVHRVDSAETNAYLATLKQIQAKKCSQICPAIACTPVTNAQCRATSSNSSSGTCVAGHILPL